MRGLLIRACAATTSRVQLESPRLTMSATALSKICSRRFSGDMRCARFLTGMNLLSPRDTKTPFYASLQSHTFGRTAVDDERSPSEFGQPEGFASAVDYATSR